MKVTDGSRKVGTSPIKGMSKRDVTVLGGKRGKTRTLSDAKASRKGTKRRQKRRYEKVAIQSGGEP